MSDHSKVVSKEELWGGGQSPFSISYGKMMMWYFLVSDALTFGGLLTAYGVIRHGLNEPWPVGEQVFEALPFLHGSYPLIYVALMTFILIVSSVTMVLAVEAGHRMDKKGVVKWLGLTVLGGLFFLSSQAWEWSHFIHGSGGGFQVDAAMTVNTKDDKGEVVPMNLTAGTWIHFKSDFGHAYEHYQEHIEEHGAEGGKIEMDPTSGKTLILVPAHDHVHGHGHAHDHGHEAADAHAGHDHADHAEKMDTLYAGELVLLVNKYVLVHENDKDYRKMEVSGSEAVKVWNNMMKGSTAFGANMSKNEYGPQQYANFFFFITGFHGFHVLQGVIINIVVWLMAIRGVFERRGHYEMVEKIGLFWHFVDLVWVFVFTFYYLV
jgi:cytochrome c oxidase subunit III